MNNGSNQQSQEKPFRFSMRTLLLVMTGVCVLAAILATFFEFFTQIVLWTLILEFSILGTYTYYSYRKSQRNPWTLPVDTVTVEVDAKWIRRIRSRWFMVVVTLTGVSLTFAPLCLLWCGSEFSKYGLSEWILVPLSLLTIYFVPGFYMQLASEVICQLMKHGISDEVAKETCNRLQRTEKKNHE